MEIRKDEHLISQSQFSRRTYPLQALRRQWTSATDKQGAFILVLYQRCILLNPGECLYQEPESL
jgi:hypothetical protein